MLRDPRVRMLALGLALAVLATVLLARPPAAVAAIPFAVPVLAVMVFVGLVLAYHSGMALTNRRRERPPHG
jgi:uncharacterized membrane protein